ncbi:MAG: hypothetical protein ACLTXI_01515 [Collinsella sp.]
MTTAESAYGQRSISGWGEAYELVSEIRRLSMYVTGIARNLYSIWREYKQ